MTKILIISKNRENINRIKKVLGSKDYEFLVKDFIELMELNRDISTTPRINHRGNEDKPTAPLEKNEIQKVEMAILDLTDRNLSSETFGITRQYNFPVLVLLSPEQLINYKDISFYSQGNFEDFVLVSGSNEEIVTRVKIILGKKENTQYKNKNIIKVGGLMLDLDKYELTIDRKVVELTFKEYELLKFLLQNQDKVFSRNKLLSTIWGYDFYGGSRTVDVHIRRLRSKLGHPYAAMLKTVINVGYMFSSKI